MRRSHRFKSMARLSRTTRHLTARLWRAAPWLLIGALLLAAGITDGSADGLWRWAGLVCALAAPLAALLLEPPHRHHPSQGVTLLAFIAVMAAATWIASRFVIVRANSFYSVSLLTEGTLLLYVLHAAQSSMRRISPAPSAAAPRVADVLVDGVRSLLIAFYIATAIAWRPIAAVMFVVTLGFAILAVLFRTPGTLARLVTSDRDRRLAE